MYYSELYRYNYNYPAHNASMFKVNTFFIQNINWLINHFNFENIKINEKLLLKLRVTFNSHL